VLNAGEVGAHRTRGTLTAHEASVRAQVTQEMLLLLLFLISCQHIVVLSAEIPEVAEV